VFIAILSQTRHQKESLLPGIRGQGGEKSRGRRSETRGPGERRQGTGSRKKENIQFPTPNIQFPREESGGKRKYSDFHQKNRRRKGRKMKKIAKTGKMRLKKPIFEVFLPILA